MNFEVGSEHEEQVRLFLEKEGIPFDSADSCHEMVVKDEALFMMEDNISEELVNDWGNDGISQTEIERRLILLDISTKDVIANARAVVNEDFSFSSVQESIKSRIMENLNQRI